MVFPLSPMWQFIALTFFIWCVLRLTLPNQQWDFDFDTPHSTFTLLYGHYFRLAVLDATASLAAAVYGSRHGVAPIGVHCCVAGAVSAILFVTWVLIRYEAYLHLRYPRNNQPSVVAYSTSQYALTLALGYSAVFYTVIGIIFVTVSIA